MTDVQKPIALERAALLFADACIGYCVCHVLVFYLLWGLVLESLGLKQPDWFGSGINVNQMLNIAVVGAVLRGAFSGRTGSVAPQTAGLSAGVVLFVFAVAMRSLVH